jgi:hypothetical protein
VQQQTVILPSRVRSRHVSTAYYGLLGWRLSSGERPPKKRNKTFITTSSLLLYYRDQCGLGCQAFVPQAYLSTRRFLAQRILKDHRRKRQHVVFIGRRQMHAINQDGRWRSPESDLLVSGYWSNSPLLHRLSGFILWRGKRGCLRSHNLNYRKIVNSYIDFILRHI